MALADEEDIEHIAIDVIDNTVLANIDTTVRITNQCRGVLGFWILEKTKDGANDLPVLLRI